MIGLLGEKVDCLKGRCKNMVTTSSIYLHCHLKTWGRGHAMSLESWLILVFSLKILIQGMEYVAVQDWNDKVLESVILLQKPLWVQHKKFVKHYAIHYLFACRIIMLFSNVCLTSCCKEAIWEIVCIMGTCMRSMLVMNHFQHFMPLSSYMLKWFTSLYKICYCLWFWIYKCSGVEGMSTKQMMVMPRR